MTTDPIDQIAVAMLLAVPLAVLLAFLIPRVLRLWAARLTLSALAGVAVVWMLPAMPRLLADFLDSPLDVVLVLLCFALLAVWAFGGAVELYTRLRHGRWLLDK